METINRMTIAVRTAALACLACTASLRAADFLWIGASGGSWTDPANWQVVGGSTTATYPGSGHDAIFMPGDGVSISVSGSANIARIAVSNGTVTVNSTSSTAKHAVQRETISEGGRHPVVYVAEGASLALTGAEVVGRGDETFTKAGGG